MTELGTDKTAANPQTLEKLEIELKKNIDFKKVLDESSIVAITDRDGIITYVNDMFCKISKYTREELLGQNHRILKSGFHSPEFYENLWETISSGKTWKGDIKNMAKDGSFYWVKTTIMPFSGNSKKPEYYIAIRTDISSQKRTEEKLRETFRDLQESQQQLIKTKNEQIESLQEIDRAKAEFLNMVSHELKNPLFPIMGFSETLQNPKIFGELSSKQLDAIKKISKNATYLHSIINDLLDIQNLELDTMEFDYGKFKVDELMRDVCKKFESIIIERKIQLIDTTQDSIVIQSDESRIKQVLSHLIDNAIAFIPKENGEIEICAQEADDTVLFYVKDNGVGISKEKQENLFKKFYQVSQGHQRKHVGVGLGLSICKEIITKLGGKIWVESKPDKATTFYFKIPKKEKKKE